MYIYVHVANGSFFFSNTAFGEKQYYQKICQLDTTDFYQICDIACFLLVRIGRRDLSVCKENATI